jgi:hypothetical protein
MKKSILFLAFTAAVVFSSCSKDDEDEKVCASCSILGISIEACDNGDGSVTVSTAGQSETISGADLDGLSAAEYVKAIEDGCPTSS